METTMELSHETLESIGHYVRNNLGTWLREVTSDRDIQLYERTVRVEEELKAQRDLMRQGFEFMEKRFEQMERRFEQVEKRFEQVDKRFEQVDKRFEELRVDMNARFQDMHTYSSRWFAVISIVLAALTIAVTVSNFVG